MANETMKTVKKVEKKKKMTEKKANVFIRFGRYVKDVMAELKRVSWPNRKELISMTGQVIVFVLVMAAIVGVLDLGFGSLFRLVYSL